VSDLISILGAACHSGQVQYLVEVPVINATWGDLRAFSPAPWNGVSVLTRCNPDLRNMSGYQVYQWGIIRAVSGGLLNDKVTQQQPYQGGRPESCERDERPISLDSDDEPKNLSNRGQLEIP
jgi:hypothetical protein